MFQALREKIAKTRNSFIGRIAETLAIIPKIDDALMEELENILIQADVGPQLSAELIDELKEAVRARNVTESSAVMGILLEIISGKLIADYGEEQSFFAGVSHQPYVIFIIGVNGTGKTTSIGKIASQFTQNGKKVLLIAADTFRAAAIEQLDIWAQRAGIDIFIKASGTDPAAVVYDGLSVAKSKKYDVAIIDTAGRQHNKENLMNELQKIAKTIGKVVEGAPHETLLVIDSTTGQNAIAQASFFHKVVPITGIILSKFDGTSKGGIVLAVKQQLGIPVKLIGVGEGIDDLQEFNATAFAEALFR